MNVIDHAILISASPAFIWRFLGDLSQNPKWQEDCTSIAFLTTQHEGKGARWRYTTPKGKDLVVEITAWYDTLGYEYMIVDGSSVGENKGRMRLQEIAEGTLVQWTYNYEVEGAFSGFRNSLGLKRNLSSNIQDSLRNLYKLIQAETGGIATHEAKALLKEAPDVEQRSSYEPRHPSSIKDNVDSYAEPDYPSEHPISYNLHSEAIPEPPVADDDTKPNPVVQGTEDIAIPVVDISEPSFLQQVQEPSLTNEDTEPNEPISDAEITTFKKAESKAVSILETSESKGLPQDSKPTPDPTTATPAPSTNIRDTASVSVFDIFGLQKPSETQEIRTLSDSDLAEAGVKPPVPPPADATQESASPSVKDAPAILEPIAIETVKTSDVDLSDSLEEDSLVAETDLAESEGIIFDNDKEPNIIDPIEKPSILKIVGLRLLSRSKNIQIRTRR